jgi:hypothetical protein
MTQEWLGEHGFLFGTEVAAPWVWNEGIMTLWFEGNISTDIDQVLIPGGMSIQGTNVVSDGLIEVYNIQGTLVNSAMGHLNTSSLTSGVYIIKSGSATTKLLIP